MGEMTPRQLLEYEAKFVHLDRPLVSSRLGGIEQVVVIPALAEKNSLPATLASLARNPDRELERTLILCVINNRSPKVCSHQDRRENQYTISYLQDLINGGPGDIPSSLRLAYLDAASPGQEMPDKYGGVGTARKLGLDKALRLLDYTRPGAKLLISLDADTLVQPDYLAAVTRHFADASCGGAGIPCRGVATPTCWVHSSQPPSPRPAISAATCSPNRSCRLRLLREVR